MPVARRYRSSRAVSAFPASRSSQPTAFLNQIVSDRRGAGAPRRRRRPWRALCAPTRSDRPRAHGEPTCCGDAPTHAFRGQLRIAEEQRSDQVTRDRVRRGPVGRLIAGEPAASRLAAAAARNRAGTERRLRCRAISLPDTDRPSTDWQTPSLRRSTTRLRCAMVDRSRQRPHRLGADVVKAKIAAAPEVAAGVEVARRPRRDA